MIKRSIGICVLVANATLVACLQAGAGQGYPSGRIAYLSTRDGQQGIFIMNADGSGQRRVTTGADLFHSWSPDGCRIVFRRQLAQIMIVGTDDTPPRLVVQTRGGDPAGDMRAYASPDSSRVVFTGRMPGVGGGKDIWVVNADGSALTNLTNAAQPQEEYYDARWSPDGTWILFDTNGVRGMSVMRADGTARRRLAEGVTGFWSSNSARVLALTPGGLKAIEVDGPPLPRPTAPAQATVRILWSVSPDASRLAFVAAQPDDTVSINVMNSDLTGERSVAKLSGQDIALYMAGPSSMPPSWSPDGSRLAFSRSAVRQLPNGGGAAGADVFAVNADGSGLTQLTHDGQSVAPAWSGTSTCR